MGKLIKYTLRKAKSFIYLLMNRWLEDIFLPLLFLPLIPVLRLSAFCFNFTLVRLYSFKIGHLAANTDILVSSHKKKCSKTKLVFFPDNTQIANQYLLRKWAENYLVVPRWIIRPLFLANKFLPFGSFCETDLRYSSDRDIEHLFDDFGPNIQFLDKELSEAKAVLDEFIQGRPVVCIICRDTGYYDKRLGEGSDSSDIYRNSDINSFRLAAEWLVNQGYTVFRMGRDSNKLFDTNNQYIIDYANSEFQSDFLDLYLASISEFVVSTSTGWDAVAKMFRIPTLYVNFCPVAYLPSYTKRDLFSFKWHIKRISGQKMTLTEIMRSGAANFLSSEEYAAKQIELRSLSELELVSCVEDMKNFVDNGCKLDKKDKKLSQDFWKIFQDNMHYIDNYNQLHNEFRSSVCPSIAKFNEGWLK